MTSHSKKIHDDDDDDDFIVTDDEINSDESYDDDDDDDEPKDIEKMLRINLNTEERRLEKKRVRENSGSDDDEDDESVTLDDEDDNGEYEREVRDTILGMLKAGNVQRTLDLIELRIRNRVYLFGTNEQWRPIVDAAASSLEWYADDYNGSNVSTTKHCFLCRRQRNLTMQIMRRSGATVGYCGRECGEAFNLLTRYYRLRNELFGMMSMLPVDDEREMALYALTNRFMFLVDNVDEYCQDVEQRYNGRKRSQ